MWNFELNLCFVFVFRARDLKKHREQRVYEREMQRITLPLSAFSNPTCELIDENTIVITAQQETTPVQEGGDPLMGQHARTPGAWASTKSSSRTVIRRFWTKTPSSSVFLWLELHDDDRVGKYPHGLVFAGTCGHMMNRCLVFCVPLAVPRETRNMFLQSVLFWRHAGDTNVCPKSCRLSVKRDTRGKRHIKNEGKPPAQKLP